MSMKVYRFATREAAAEVAGRGGIGNAARAEGIEVILVVATQFDVLQAGAVAQGVVGDVENVIGIVVGHVDLQAGASVGRWPRPSRVGGPAGGWRRCRRSRCRRSRSETS